MIPRLIHFVWTGKKPLPEWGRRHMAEFARLNPGYEVRLHGDEALAPDYAYLAGQCTDPAQVADLIRYSVLEREGGWYFDLDFLPFRPLAEAEAAWGITGDKLALARIRGHRSGEIAPFANGILAAAPGLPVWRALAAHLTAQAVAGVRQEGRCVYGPLAVNWLVREHASDLLIMDAAFWFPSSIDDAAADLAAVRADPGWARIMCPLTGGQLPYAMHLWAGAGTPIADIDAAPPRRLVLLMADAEGPELGHAALADRWPDGHPLAAAREGLTAAGFDVICKGAGNVGRWPRLIPGGIPRAAVVWNGRQMPTCKRVADLELHGVPCYRIEHGFLDRRRWVQCDRRGILHWASWAGDWNGTLPADAEARLAQVWSRPIVPMHARDAGPVLVVGQVTGDTQLQGAPLEGPAPLEQIVSRNLPRGADARFREHPKMYGKRPDSTYSLPHSARDEDLHAALSDCRFVVTINSNTIVEATALGVPCLAFGPSTAMTAGVARQATVETIAADLAAMFGGWCPDAATARAYLLHLACRQYSCNELRTAIFWTERIK